MLRALCSYAIKMTYWIYLDPTSNARRVEGRLSRLIAFAGLGAVALGLAGGAQALVWKEDPTLPEIIHRSSLAFRGQVVDVVTHNLQEDPNIEEPDLYSEVIIRVDKGYRGVRDNETVTIRQVGGERKDGYWMDIAGLYQYQTGESVVVFQNDREQPVFATLFGDHGLRRLAAMPSGDTLVMSQYGTPILYDGRTFKTWHGYCLPNPQDPRFCEAWLSEDGYTLNEPHGYLTVERFDDLVRRELANRPDPGFQPQTLETDAEFRAVLEAWFNRLDQAYAPQ